LSIADAVLDFSLVAGHVRPRRQKRSIIVFGERSDFGIQLRIKSIGLLHRSAKVINDQSAGQSTKVLKGIFKASEKLMAGLAVDSLAVCLARVRQNDPKKMCVAALVVVSENPCTRAKINLFLVTRVTF
jgi:hypothetical protein